MNLFFEIWIQYFCIELVFTIDKFDVINMFFHRGVTHFLKYEFSLFTLNLSFKKRSLLNLFFKIWVPVFLYWTCLLNWRVYLSNHMEGGWGRHVHDLMYSLLERACTKISPKMDEILEKYRHFRSHQPKPYIMERIIMCMYFDVVRISK